MVELLPAQKETLEKIKKEHKYPIGVAKINNALYLYEVKSEIVDGKPKSTTLYLGKLEKDGTLKLPRHKKRHNDAKTLEEAIKIRQNPKNNHMELYS